MGAWGYFSDENDLVLDYVGDIENRVLPEKLKECQDYDVEEEFDCNLPEEKVKALKAKLRAQIGKDLGMTVFQNMTTTPPRCSIHATTPKTEQCLKDKRQYMVDHPEKVLSAVKKLDIDPASSRDDVVAGVALFLARGWQGTPIMPSELKLLKTTHRGHPFPKLPSNFPPELAQMAREASERLIGTAETVAFDRAGALHRRKAMEEQVALFQ